MFAIGRVTTQSKKRNLLSKSDIALIAPKSSAVIATISMIKAIRKRGTFTATSWGVDRVSGTDFEYNDARKTFFRFLAPFYSPLHL